MDFITLGYYIHFFIPILFMLIPFFPFLYLQYAVFTPSAIYLLWIVCDGCPLTHITQGTDEDFIQSILFKISPKLSKNTDNIVGFILTFMLAIVGHNCINLCN